MNDRTTELAFEIADSAARSDIEAYCKPAERAEIGTWYFDRSHEREYSAFVEKAIEYLTLRNRIARHPEHADWIRVNFDVEVMKEVSSDIKLPKLPEHAEWIYAENESGYLNLFTADQMRDYALSAVRENVPEGWQLVPKELTRKMADALCLTSQVDAYKAMLAVAPKYNTAPDSEGGK